MKCFNRTSVILGLAMACIWAGGCSQSTTTPDCAVAPFALPPIPSPTNVVHVYDLAALRAAAADTVNGPRTIVLHGNYNLGGQTLSFPATPHLVRLVGGDRNGNTISCNMTWDGKAENGIEVNSHKFIIRDIIIRDYDTYGSALKWNADNQLARLFVVDDCKFRQIGMTYIDPASTTPRYNQCIGIHEKVNAFVSVTDCEFTDCVRSSHAWSHCLYVDGFCVIVNNNTFTRTGNPFAIGSYVPTIAEITNNRVYEPAMCMDKDGKTYPAFLSVFKPISDTLFWNNIVGKKTQRAKMHIPMRWNTNTKLYSDKNLYYLDGFDNRFGVEYNVGYYTVEEWRAAHDKGSYWY